MKGRKDRGGRRKRRRRRRRKVHVAPTGTYHKHLQKVAFIEKKTRLLQKNSFVLPSKLPNMMDTSTELKIIALITVIVIFFLIICLCYSEILSLLFIILLVDQHGEIVTELRFAK